MTVCFEENIIIKTFDEQNIYPLKLRKCKKFDGPNNFSILWNQLLILVYNNIIYDKNTLINKFNIKILKLYQKEILKEIDTILYKFLELNINSITLYYDKYHIKRDNNIISKLKNLNNYIKEL